MLCAFTAHSCRVITQYRADFWHILCYELKDGNPSGPPERTGTEYPQRGGSTIMAFRLTSAVIADGQPIPRRYSCEEHSISPPLAWDDPPAGTQSFALLLDDPDA